MLISPKLLGVAIAATLIASLHASSAQAAGSSPATRAHGLLESNPSAAHRNPGDGFAVRDVMVDANGTEHVRMDRTYKGLPMFGGDIVVHSRNGKLRSVTHSVRSNVRPTLQAKVSADAALETAATVFGPGFDQVLVLRQVVYARHVAPMLAWEVRLVGSFTTGAPLDMTFFVDASSGKLLLGYSNIQFAGGKERTDSTTTASVGAATLGTGRSLHNGSVLVASAATSTGFTLTDPTRGNSVTSNANNAGINFVGSKATPFTDADNSWGNGTTRDASTVAVDAHYGAATAWDYYAEIFGRRGIHNDGAGTVAYVHVQRNWANAMWHNGAMYLGDGDRTFKPMVSLDIVAHEMTHGVTQATAGLVYSAESGGLNEATSDIFGTMVEFFGTNPSDPPDYTLGETVSMSAPVRYMYKPSLDGKSPDCFSSAVASMNPHQASGIGNHFFYLLAEGAVVPSGSSLSAYDLVCNGNTGLRGIGRDAAQKIWYQALTRYMTSSTNYAAAREATLQASSDLFGAGSVQQQAVAAAWSAVSVN